ncbi:MAG: alpha/beta hydrolase [Betaproteobacteria bacterium]|nr:alpha/beta hydrolase [Betaproteobacteria bacterium]
MRLNYKYTKGFVAHGDAEIYCEICGAGPALVFAHGLGGNHLSWWQQVAHFSGRYTCVVFSHRGFAPSRLQRGEPDPADFAGDLEALIDHLGLDDVRLVAQSMGGWTCLEYALHLPERVRALVLACTTGTADPARLRDADPAALARWSENAALRVKRLRAADIHPAAGERMARDRPALHHLYRQIDSLNAGLDKEALRRRLYAARTTGPERLAALNMPVLCISGAEDVVIPTAAVRALSSALPSGSFEEHPGSGHSVYFEHARWFNERLDRFLRI